MYSGYNNYTSEPSRNSIDQSRPPPHSNSFPAPSSQPTDQTNRDNRSSSASSNRHNPNNLALRDTPEPMSPGPRTAFMQKSYNQNQYQSLDPPSAHPGRQRASSANVTSSNETDAGRHWPLERVLIWLAGNNFSEEWQETIRTLNIHGNDFLLLGQGSGGRGNLEMLHQVIYPQLEKICKNSKDGWDPSREREESKRMRRLIRRIADSDKAASAGIGHRRNDSGFVPSASTDGGVEDSPSVGRFEHASPPSLHASESSPVVYTQPTSAASLSAHNSIQMRSNTIPYSKQSSSSSTPSEPRPSESLSQQGRPEHRTFLNNFGLKGRHSPHLSGDAAAGLTVKNPSPGSSPGLAHAAPAVSPSHANSRTDHRRGASTDSMSRSRASTNGVSPGGLSAGDSSLGGQGQDCHDGTFANNKEPNRGFLSKFINRSKRNETHSTIEEQPGESPSSPASSRNMPFSNSKGAVTDASLVPRPSSAAANSRDNPLTRARTNSARSPAKRYILVTPDQWNYRLIDIADVETAKEMRSLIYSELSIENTEFAQIFVTELGKTDHSNALTDDMLTYNRQHRNDLAGVLKLFVRTPPTTSIAGPLSPSGGLGLSFAQRMNTGSPSSAGAHSGGEPMVKAHSAGATPQIEPFAWQNGTADSDSLAKAAEDYKREAERKQKAYLETRQLRLEPTNSPADVSGIRGNRLVDFDSPRISPYEEKKQENMIPQRKPPAAPSESTTLTKVNSLSKKPSERFRASGLDALKRMSNPIAEEPADRGRKHANGSPASMGIGAVLANVGKMATTPATTGSQASPEKSGQRPLQSVDFTHRGSSPGTSNRPDYTWGKGNVLFKNPAYEDNTLQSRENAQNQPPPNAAVRGLRKAAKNASPQVSPASASRPPFSSRPSQGPDNEFTETNISFTNRQSTQPPSNDNGSDDSDDGLFAVPLFNKTQSSDSASQATKREGKPTLEVNTDVNKRAKTVAFKSPGSSAGIHNDSSRYSGPDDGSVVSDMSAADRSHSDSANTSSPDDRMGRRESFVSDIWANRPAVENVVNHLDEFFPGVDLDMPFMETKPDSQPSSASEATETRPTSLRGKVTYGTEGLPLDFTKRNESDTLGSDESTLKAKDRGTITNVAQRQKDKIGGLSRMKSIREVAKVRNDTNRGPSSSAQAPPTRGGGGLLRRKSTKMFGANIVQIKPKPGNRLSTLDPIPQEEVPTEDTPKRQATFKIIRGQLIGKGTYGRVYLGMNATTGEFLAVKHVEVNAKVAGQDRDRIKELVAAMDVEIDTMQHLEHPNIVQYLGCERRELSISIYLEYIPGGSIGSCLRKHGRFEEPVVRSLTRQTLEGLAYLHGQGILHRDLKADNILLDLDGTCKISDFGISKRSDDIYGNDASNSMQGSVFWMAPEVVRSQGQGYSAKVDVWSLGCVVLEMFAGKRPWSKEEVVGAIFKLGSLNQAPPIPEDVQATASVDGLAFMYDCFQV